jgi:hypothetical protein
LLRTFLRHTGIIPKKKKKQANGDLAESVEKLAVADEPRVKSKNLNVVDEFEKSGMKRMANFVVVGMWPIKSALMS